VSEIPERIGDYRVLGLLGRGGMGSVYRAVRYVGHDGDAEGDAGGDEVALRDTRHRDGDEVALKVLAEGMGEDASALRRFELELEALSRLDHPGVTRALGPMERKGGRIYFPMEYVRGQTLQAVLADEGALPLQRAVAIARAIFDALSAAHGVGVVHRDVKPSNILMADGHDGVKVADFGLARLMDATRVTSTGQILGTLSYMAPEQCEGARHVDARADVYATGVVLYEMLAGRPPFRADTPVALLREHIVTPPPPIEGMRSDVPPELARFLAECLAKRPDDRVQSSAAAIERLDALPDLADTCALREPGSDEAPSQRRVEMAHTSPAGGVATATDVAAGGAPAIGGAPRRASWPTRIGLAIVGVALVAAVWAVGQRAGKQENGARRGPATALWSRLRSSIADPDYDAFLTCFTPELQAKLGRDEKARRRFEFAVDGLAAAEVTAGSISGNLASGRMRVQITGDALPTAIGMPAEAASGLQVDVVRTGDGWRIADARPTRPMKQPGGDPVERAANRAILSLSQIDRLARTLQDTDVDQLTREQRRLLSEWMDEVRAAELPPQMAFALDPSRFDAETGAWKVDVVFRSLAAKLGAPATHLAIVLGPAPASRSGRDDREGRNGRGGGGRRGTRYRIAESRLIVR